MHHEEFRYLDYITCPVFVLEPGPDGDPVYAAFNLFACNATGFDLASVIGRTAAQVYGDRLGQTATRRHRQAFAQGKTITYALDLPIGGEIMSLRTTLCPVRDAQGQVTRLFGSSVNVTEKQAAQESKVAYETLTSEIEQFVTMAAHDLRTPMRNVALLAEMLRDGFEDHGDGKLQLIDMLEDVALKSSTLISDVLTHARATTIRPETEEFNFADLLQDIFCVLDPKGHHVLRCPADEIIADRAALQIVLRNLIDNALKHAGRENVTIDVTLHASFDSMLSVTVADNGAGFANPGQVFLSGGKFKVDSGYGMLGIHRLVTARGGQITASNDPATGGSQVRFSLPGIWVAQGETLCDSALDHLGAPLPSPAAGSDGLTG